MRSAVDEIPDGLVSASGVLAFNRGADKLVTISAFAACDWRVSDCAPKDDFGFVGGGDLRSSGHCLGFLGWCRRCVGQLKGLCAGFEIPQEKSSERAKKVFPPENGKRLDTFAKIQTGG
jgi:hypothetical protein